MTIEFRISGDDAAQIRNQIVKLFGTASQTLASTEAPDDQADNANLAQQPVASVDQRDPAELAPAPKKPRGRPRKVETQPESVAEAEDDAETEQADDADEQQAAAEQGNGKLNHDDVRSALSRYMKKFGIGPAQLDGPKVLGMLFGDGATKVSDVPNDQDSLAKAIAGVEEMLTKNPFKRVPV